MGLQVAKGGAKLPPGSVTIRADCVQNLYGILCAELAWHEGRIEWCSAHLFGLSLIRIFTQECWQRRSAPGRLGCFFRFSRQQFEQVCERHAATPVLAFILDSRTQDLIFQNIVRVCRCEKYW